MVEQKATNVTWHDGNVERSDRQKLLGQKGATLWFTGLSGSGNIRLGINKNLGFSAEDRAENIRRIGEVSKLFCDTGVICLSSFVSPYITDRDIVRELHKAADIPFIEIFMKTSLAVAEERDPKGLYKKARAGEIKNFTGIDDPYEEPINPEIVLDTEKMTVEEEVNALLDELRNLGVILDFDS